MHCRKSVAVNNEILKLHLFTKYISGTVVWRTGTHLCNRRTLADTNREILIPKQANIVRNPQCFNELREEAPKVLPCKRGA